MTKNSNPLPSEPMGDWHEPYFTPAPPKMLDIPVTGSVEICDRYPPRIKYAGTLWRFRILGAAPTPLTHRQLVTIVGRQGNSLLIKI